MFTLQDHEKKGGRTCGHFAIYHNEVGVISPYFIDDKIGL